jgi:hypothetical protein
MLTIVFLVFVAMFLVAGTFISIEAKQRKDGSLDRSRPSSNQPGMGPDKD